MEAHAVPTLRESSRAGTVVRTGAIAGLAAGMMMAMWQMVVGAIATEPTAVAGIDSSFWTPVTAIPSVILGQQWFHGSFDSGSVFLGLMGHMMNAIVLGVIGVASLVAILGTKPKPVAAIMLGALYGLLLEVLIVNLIVNNAQDVHTLYTSTPEWSWWAAHAMFGMTLGLVATVLLRRSPD